MIITCPNCQKKLRINKAKYAGKKLALTCRNCNRSIPCVVPAVPRILVAHGEPEVCRTVLDLCQQDVGEILTCGDASMARKLMEGQSFAALLLDVALPGAFPFQLIDEIQRSGLSTKVILLPSVYSRTAYKRKPSSLYGADGYLELHHLHDQLIPLLHDMLPELALKSPPHSPPSEGGDERPLTADADVRRQAEELARLLIADIALYNQDQIDLGIEQRDIESRLAAELEEGRRMLACRIPQAELDKEDYLLSALIAFAEARKKELGTEAEERHG
jgi:CheY-like chemotaxis protein